MRTIGVVTTVFVVALAGAGLLTTTHAQKQKGEASTQVVTLAIATWHPSNGIVFVRVAWLCSDNPAGLQV